MSRSSTTPGPGHNGHRELNDEEMGALVTSFTTKIIDAQRKADATRLEREGWAAPTRDEAEFVEADNGRTIRAA